MKNKVYKKITAAGAALMMAVSGMTMGASAEVAIGGSVYQLHYNSGAGLK